MATTAPMVDPATGTRSPFHGEILDGDGHMYLHPRVAEQLFGDRAEMCFVNNFLKSYTASEQFEIDRERNRRELWHVKGIGALGATDPVERLEALDRMGIRAQLIHSNNNIAERYETTPDAFAAMRNYNDFALDFQKASQGRAHMVLPLNMTSVDAAMAELDRIIARGAKAVGLAANEPPGGVSPASELWDPLWARLEEADVTAILHLGAGGLLAEKDEIVMMPHRGWGKSVHLKGTPADRPGGEEAISPYFMLVAHMPVELYLQTMVMGQVFERFPRLRLGIIECGANWVGPLTERMDLWVEFMGKVGRKYPMKPSEYLARNVRVTPFWHENLPLMIERYGLPEVYIYSTDYPHLEGSRDPVGKFQKWLNRMPESYARDFYVNNPKWLFPSA